MSFGILLVWAARPAREERRESARADGFVRKKGFGDVCAQRNDLLEQQQQQQQQQQQRDWYTARLKFFLVS
jgi:hypothetical protein